MRRHSTDVLAAALALLAGLGCAPSTDDGTPPTDDVPARIQDGSPTAPPLPAWPELAEPARKALLAGSWTPADSADFDQAWIDEAGLRETYSGRRAGRRLWAGMRTAGDVLPVDTLVRDRRGPAVAYVYVLVMRDRDGDRLTESAYDDEPAVLHLRHRGRVAAWFDGERVIDAAAPTDGGWRHVAAPVRLTEAFDVLLLKCGRGSPELGPTMDVEVRLSTPEGEPVPLQAWNTMRPPGYPREASLQAAGDDG